MKKKTTMWSKNDVDIHISISRKQLKHTFHFSKRTFYIFDKGLFGCVCEWVEQDNILPFDFWTLHVGTHTHTETHDIEHILRSVWCKKNLNLKINILLCHRRITRRFRFHFLNGSPHADRKGKNEWMKKYRARRLNYYTHTKGEKKAIKNTTTHRVKILGLPTKNCLNQFLF